MIYAIIVRRICGSCEGLSLELFVHDNREIQNANIYNMLCLLVYLNGM